MTARTIRTGFHAMAAVAMLALAGIPLSASAAFITGSISMSGDFVPTGGAGLDLSDATGLDFTGDDFDVDVVTGDFATAGIMAGDIGTINDFQFNPLSPAPVDPLWTIDIFDFALASIDSISQGAAFLELTGSGTISGTGFFDTDGIWVLTANTSGTGTPSLLFNFSSGTGALPTVPEPGTLLLLGIGIAGLAANRRRKI